MQDCKYKYNAACRPRSYGHHDHHRGLRASDAHMLGPAHTAQPRELRRRLVAEMKEVGRAMRNVFAVPEEGGPHIAVSQSDLTPVDDYYVDAPEDLIHRNALLPANSITGSPEEVCRIAQSPSGQTRRFRKWVLE